MPDARRILVVDDDETFRNRLVSALRARHLEASGAGNLTDAVALAQREQPSRAVIDLRMPRGSGLDLLRELTAVVPGIQVVVLTGYGSIATATEAVRRGALDYLSKPADTEQILAAFARAGDREPEEVESAPSLARVEWEHIHRVLTDCEGNISQAARVLGIHRRSLQRKLGKLPPLE